MPDAPALPVRRWTIAALLFLATVINYVDRQIFAVLAPLFSADLRISEIQYGLIVQAFLAPYTMMFLFSGYLIDRYGTRLGLAACMSWWSAAAALHALARGPWSMGAFRCLLGAGESGNYTAAAKAVSEWFPPEERSLATGIYSAGTAVGAIVCPPLSVWLAARYGWRQAFFCVAVTGLLWLIPWLLFYRGTRSPACPKAPATEAGEGFFVRCRALLRLRPTHALFWTRVISEPVWWFYLFWLPKYLRDVQGFTMAEIGYTLWIPYVAADAGSLLGGLASGRLARRGIAPPRARRLVMLPCAALMPVTLLLLVQLPAFMVLGAVCVALFSHMAWKVNLMTLTNDLFPATHVASVSGVLAFGSGLGGVVFAGLAGVIVSSGSYAALFVMIAFLHPAAFGVLSWLLREDRSRAGLPGGQEHPSPAGRIE